MNDCMERIWKEAVVAGICLDGVRKAIKPSSQITDILAEIRTENFLNGSQGC
jgi:hypothetical protein